MPDTVRTISLMCLCGRGEAVWVCGRGVFVHLLSGRDQFASLRVTHFSSQDLVTRHPFIRSNKAIEPWYFQ